MKKTALIFIIAIAVFATGCPRTSPKLDLDQESVKKAAVTQLKTVVFKNQFAEYQCWKSGKKAIPTFKQNEPECVGASCTNDNADPIVAEAKAQEIRNRVFDEGRGLIDETYGKYADALRRNRSVGDFLADLLEIGLGASIGIVNGRVRTLQILGVALTGFRGARKSANLRLFDDQTTEVILDKMDASRAEVILKFENTDRKKSTQDYTFEAALTDIYKYFRVGTQTEAFKRIRRDAATDADNKEKQVLQIREINPNQIVSTPLDVSQAQVTIGEIRSRYIDIARLPDTPQPNADAKTKLSENLKKVFDEITTGAKANDFKPYLDKVKLIPNTAYKDWIEKLSSTNAAVVGQITVAQRLEVILALLQQIYAEQDEGKKNPLILPLKESLVKNQ